MKFTPEVLLSAPRRSPGVPNPSGTLILYTQSSYSFQTHQKTSELRVLSVETGESHELGENVETSDLNWLDDDVFVSLQAEKNGATSLHVASVSKCLEKGLWSYVAGVIDAAAGNLKVCSLDEGKGEEFAVVVSAVSCPDGSLFTPEKAARKTQSSGRLYESLYVRHWDHYQEAERASLWYGTLSKTQNRDPKVRRAQDVDGQFVMSSLTNALKGTSLESPIAPFGGTDNFDISPHGLIFVAKDPKVNPALNTTCGVYIQGISSWTSEKEDESPAIALRRVVVPKYQGACTSPVFAPGGKQAAFLMMKKNGYEADRNTIFMVDVGGSDEGELRAEAALEAKEDEAFWDHSPSSVVFSADGGSWLVIAEDQGRARVFNITTQSTGPLGRKVRTLTVDGYASAATPLRDGRVFVSGSSLVDNSRYAIVDPGLQTVEEGGSSTTELTIWSHSNSSEGSKLGLRRKQVSTIWTPASNPDVNKEIQSWVFKPSTFDASKKYPVAYLIHGGPQGSWADSWSTRWNPAVFAEQGYIVIAPNVTGSTGYGQQFTDAIRNNWGGDPYQDIVNCFEWVGENMPEADNERAVALGASYGGYMMNWIQGHDLGRKLKALVCHDGIFSFAGGLLATEELYFPFNDLGSTPWYSPKSKNSPPKTTTPTVAEQASANFGNSTFSDWRQWDPSEHLSEWATPQLVIHSSKDYRLGISEGLAAFNVLQARGVESQFLTFPDENHFVLKPENSLVWHKTVLNFINKHVGLPPFTEEDPKGAAYFGGWKSEGEEAADMPAQGKPET